MSTDAGGTEPNKSVPGATQPVDPRVFDYASQAPPPVVIPAAEPDLLKRILSQLRARLQANPIYAFGIGGIVLGILVGIGFASTMRSVEAPGRYDLGIVTSNDYGLKGHLYTEWNENLDYHLTVEPSYSEHEDGFAMAVNHAPRPLSIGIQLKNKQGQVVCSAIVLLRFDSRSAVGQSVPSTAGGGAAADQAAQDAANPRLDAQELERERGKHVFQSGLNRDGEVDALHSQDEIPCPRKAYDSIVAWSMAPDFPKVEEQEAWLHPLVPIGNAPKAMEARRKPAAKPVAKPFAFFIEGDDTIAGFDASTGAIETGSGRIFLIDKTSAAANAIKSLDYPVHIHYKCDQHTTCSVARQGAAILLVRLRK